MLILRNDALEFPDLKKKNKTQKGLAQAARTPLYSAISGADGALGGMFRLFGLPFNVCADLCRWWRSEDNLGGACPEEQLTDWPSNLPVSTSPGSGQSML